jgi:two-component system OmpR family sensor kinase
VTAATAATRGRRSWSLRTRLLAGLIALTATFLVVMGVVSTVVLRTLEQDQSNTELRLAAGQSVQAIAQGTDGFSAAYLSLRTGTTGELTPASAPGAELRTFLDGLAGEPRAQVLAYLREQAAQEEPFDLAVNSGPAMRVAWRPVDVLSSRQSGGLLPLGATVVLVGRQDNAVASHVRGVVLAEVITGGVLLALLAGGGNWLIGRGLAPLDRMASTADVITNSGDLAARMPDAGDRQETGRLAAAINTMLDRIQQAFGARLRSEQKVRQFAADASHELRTPLTTIRGYAELVRQGAFSADELPNAMRRIEQESERMSMLVAELLELARLDRTSSLDLTETDLAILARDAVADARAVEPEREVSAQVPPSLVVTADEPRIRQVLANLLGNVRTHTPPGTAATVRLYPDGDGAVLEVSDNGPGMSEQDASRAFDRFHRGGRGNGAGGYDGAEAAGSGLGLSIVQAIAAAHGGQARLHSAPGSGTTVQLWIPVKNEKQLSRTDRFFAQAGLVLPSGRLRCLDRTEVANERVRQDARVRILTGARAAFARGGPSLSCSCCSSTWSATRRHRATCWS